MINPAHAIGEIGHHSRTIQKKTDFEEGGLCREHKGEGLRNDDELERKE